MEKIKAKSKLQTDLKKWEAPLQQLECRMVVHYRSTVNDSPQHYMK